MKLHRTLAAAALALASFTAMADNVTTALDLTGGNTFFGRSNAVGSFVDTYTFSVAGSSFLLNSAITTSNDEGQRITLTSVVVRNAANAVVGNFNQNSSSSANAGWFVLSPRLFDAGSYSIVVTGTNSPLQASYAGTVAVAVPEPGTALLSLVGLAAFGLVAVRRRRHA